MSTADHRTDILPNRNRFYLYQFRNVIMTQHMAFYTRQAVANMVRCGVDGFVGMARDGTLPPSFKRAAPLHLPGGPPEKTPPGGDCKSNPRRGVSGAAAAYGASFSVFCWIMRYPTPMWV